LGILIFTIIILIFITTGDNLSGGDTDSGETYLGGQGDNCICHYDKVTNWSDTDHADPEGEFWNMHGTNMYNDSYCGPCHVLGWDEISLEGFDPGQAWNSTYNQERWTIQCENCHGPASAHVGGLSPDNINIDRDPYISCFGHGEAGCHSGTRQWGTETIPGWNQSAHAPHDNHPDDHGLNTYCAQCKSPSQWDPTASYGDSEFIALEDWRGITCGDCHNSHNVTPYKAQLRWDPDLICEQCHTQGNHETMRNKELVGEPSVDRDDYPYMDNVTCVDCHMYDTSNYVPEEWTTIGHSFEPRIEACVACHTTIYEDLPEEDYPHANWTAWNATLQQALQDWRNNITGQQEVYDFLFEEADELYFEAEGLKEIAEENCRWTEDMEDIFEQAEYDFDLADHQSRGAHNPEYALALLNASKDRFNIILGELSTCLLKGEVKNSQGPIEGVNITVNGYQTITDSQGQYTLIVDSGIYTVNASKNQFLNESVSEVVCPSAYVVWLNFTVDDDFDNDGIPDPIDDDDDDDEVLDEDDAFPYDPLEWLDTDSDGIGDNADTDDDGDDVPDVEDEFPKDPTEWIDTDSDDIGDNADLDDDGDGILDEDDAFPKDPLEWEDFDSDDTGDNADLDDDNDGHLDVDDLFPKDPLEWADFDLDDIGDNADLDDDGDGILDEVDAFPYDPLEWLDTDSDKTGNNADLDDDNDGYLDPDDEFPLDASEWMDSDSDGTGDNSDPDDDGDGILDDSDEFPADKTEWADNDKDGIGDNADPDDDNDSHLDVYDYYPFDGSRWKKGQDVESFDPILFLPIILGILIFALIVVILLEKRKKQPEIKEDIEDEAPPPKTV
jgi:predicted CXXCH cytochrome family protein